MNDYQPKDPWRIDERDFPAESALEKRLEFLLRYALLAPSRYNTQPWKFRITPEGVEVYADRTRWLRFADPEQQELHLSVGCALENLLVAASHFGLGYELIYFPDQGFSDHVATVLFPTGITPSSSYPTSLFKAIPIRHTSHSKHDRRPVSNGHLNLLQNCSLESGIHLYLTSDLTMKGAVDGLVAQGNIVRFADPDYRSELAYWIGQGAFGNTWLISKLGELAYAHVNLGKSEAARGSDLLSSSPAIGVICSTDDSRTSQVQAGQVFQRVALLAASMGIWTQPMSHIIEIPDLRQELTQLIPVPNAVMQHPFRLGTGKPEAQHTPRRPLAELLVEM